MANSKLSALRVKLDEKIAASKTNGFYSNTQKDSSLNTAGARVCNYRDWKSLELIEDGDDTVANQENYSVPGTLQDDSIRKIRIDGDTYDKKEWDDYQDYRDNERDEKVFATFDGEYYVNPVPTEAGLEVKLYGIKKWVRLEYSEEEEIDGVSILPPKFDEAVVDLAFADCLDRKKDYSGALVIRKQVEDPANPQIPGSGGILARLAAREEEGSISGSTGKAQSTRFMM